MAAQSTTPPPLQVPTAKEKKYDRQLRLWAASGQQTLEDARVLLLISGSAAVGVETLKNLILPGIGNFTIVDQELVRESDLGVNFFLTEKSLGKSRAQETCKYLQELNSDVNGQAVQESTASFLKKKNLLDQYSLIILTGWANPPTVLEEVSDYAWQRSIPLFYVRSLGFFSEFSLQLPSQFPIVDTHPDPASTEDLRLLQPWSELSDHARLKTDNLENLDDHTHGHIPYVLLLLHYLDVYKSSHQGKAPATYAEKKDFKILVQSGARTNNAEGGEENYDQAVTSVLKSLHPPSITRGLQETFNDEDCKSPRSNSANFWIIANALQNFYLSHGVLPLPGALPDMKAQSADYIELQNIYKAKARNDLAQVVDRVRMVEGKLQRVSPVDEKEIEAFCKGAAFIKLIKGQRLRSHLPSSSEKGRENLHSFCRELQNEDSLLSIHISFTIYDHIMAALIPPNIEGPCNLDEIHAGIREHIANGTGLFRGLENLWGGLDGPSVQHCREKVENSLAELIRAKGGELHNISALTGGMVAQEVIKVITKQYVPIDNTCVFNGVLSKTEVFRRHGELISEALYVA